MRAVRGWVLRAGDKNAVPIDLDSFTEGAPSQDAVNNPLTVLGTGDVAWAAYYDNCVNASRSTIRSAMCGGTRQLSRLRMVLQSRARIRWASQIGALADGFQRKMKQLGWQLATWRTGRIASRLRADMSWLRAAWAFNRISCCRDLAYNDAHQYDACGGVATRFPTRHRRCRSSTTTGMRSGRTPRTVRGGLTRRSCTDRWWRSAGRPWAGPGMKTDCSPARSGRPTGCFSDQCRRRQYAH